VKLAHKLAGFPRRVGVLQHRGNTRSTAGGRELSARSPTPCCFISDVTRRDGSRFGVDKKSRVWLNARSVGNDKNVVNKIEFFRVFRVKIHWRKCASSMAKPTEWMQMSAKSSLLAFDRTAARTGSSQHAALLPLSHGQAPENREKRASSPTMRRFRGDQTQKCSMKNYSENPDEPKTDRADSLTYSLNPTPFGLTLGSTLEHIIHL
jgi:hypothetical protein